MKVCTKCKKEKPDSDFNKRRRNKDGLDSHCRSCANERVRQWRSENPVIAKDSAKRSGARYYKKNKARLDKINKEYAKSHCVQISERRRKQRAKNITWHRERDKKYHRNRCGGLTDSYITGLLIGNTSMKRSDIPQMLIDAKRIHLTLKREIENEECNRT